MLAVDRARPVVVHVRSHAGGSRHDLCQLVQRVRTVNRKEGGCSLWPSPRAIPHFTRFVPWQYQKRACHLRQRRHQAASPSGITKRARMYDSDAPDGSLGVSQHSTSHHNNGSCSRAILPMAQLVVATPAQQPSIEMPHCPKSPQAAHNIPSPELN